MSRDQPQAVPSIDELLSDPAKAAGLSLEVAKVLWINISNLEKALVLRMVTASATMSPPEDRLVDIEEAASILSMSKDRLYRKNYPFTVRDGGLLRFSHNGIQRFIQARLRQS